MLFINSSKESQKINQELVNKLTFYSNILNTHVILFNEITMLLGDDIFIPFMIYLCTIMCTIYVTIRKVNLDINNKELLFDIHFYDTIIDKSKKIEQYIKESVDYKRNIIYFTQLQPMLEIIYNAHNLHTIYKTHPIYCNWILNNKCSEYVKNMENENDFYSKQFNSISHELTKIHHLEINKHNVLREINDEIINIEHSYLFYKIIKSFECQDNQIIFGHYKSFLINSCLNSKLKIFKMIKEKNININKIRNFKILDQNNELHKLIQINGKKESVIESDKILAEIKNKFIPGKYIFKFFDKIKLSKRTKNKKIINFMSNLPITNMIQISLVFFFLFVFIYKNLNVMVSICWDLVETLTSL